jgi:hypothetical protein
MRVQPAAVRGIHETDALVADDLRQQVVRGVRVQARDRPRGAKPGAHSHAAGIIVVVVVVVVVMMIGVSCIACIDIGGIIVVTALGRVRGAAVIIR